MNTIRIVVFTAALALLLALVSAPMLRASNESHRAKLLGFEEVPAISSTGTGELRLKIDEDNVHTNKHPGGEIRGQIEPESGS